jgi:replicative DNA helicase
MSGYLVDADWPSISNALMLLDRMPFHVSDGSSQTAIDVRLACRRLKSESGLGLVVVDYVQLMPGTVERKNATRTEELTDISRRLKELAVELEVPVIVLSQLNRAGDSRGDSRPRLSDLRECGALEQDADIVLFLHRKHHRDGGKTECILEKQRNGPTGTVNLNLDRDITTFVEGPASEPESEKTEEQKALELKADRRRHFARRGRF